MHEIKQNEGKICKKNAKSCENLAKNNGIFDT
jgi:hypothetical protein